MHGQVTHAPVVEQCQAMQSVALESVVVKAVLDIRLWANKAASPSTLLLLTLVPNAAPTSTASSMPAGSSSGQLEDWAQGLFCMA